VRALITGASGFAGGWLCRACLKAGDEVRGISRSGTAPVGRSWTEPARTLEANVGGAAALLEAIRLHAPETRVVWVSSSEVYGTVATMPIAETVECRPESPYAVSKLAAEQLAAVYAQAHGLRVVIARPFSHSGPGQRPIFLLSNITRQAVTARHAGRSTLRLVTGNGEVRRDVTDVRDVVRAYRLLAAGSLTGVVNVCTGVTRSTAEQVAELARQVPDVEIQHAVDPALVRASEVMELRGDPTRLESETGWRPAIPFERTLADTLAHWEHEPPG
jgi:GDP-4-dehydro-6-deoxy-D-mannose reductase